MLPVTCRCLVHTAPQTSAARSRAGLPDRPTNSAYSAVVAASGRHPGRSARSGGRTPPPPEHLLARRGGQDDHQGAGRPGGSSGPAPGPPRPGATAGSPGPPRPRRRSTGRGRRPRPGPSGPAAGSAAAGCGGRGARPPTRRRPRTPPSPTRTAPPGSRRRPGRRRPWRPGRPAAPRPAGPRPRWRAAVGPSRAGAAPPGAGRRRCRSGRSPRPRRPVLDRSATGWCRVRHSGSIGGPRPHRPLGAAATICPPSQRAVRISACPRPSSTWSVTGRWRISPGALRPPARLSPVEPRPGPGRPAGRALRRGAGGGGGGQPLERAQQTATPIAAAHGLEVRTDLRLIETSNIFEGRRKRRLVHPPPSPAVVEAARPARPSWGSATSTWSSGSTPWSTPSGRSSPAARSCSSPTRPPSGLPGWPSSAAASPTGPASAAARWPA